MTTAQSGEIAQMRLDYSTDQRVWDLLNEVERLRDLVGQHDPTGADHLAEMMEHAQRADALYDENKRLRDALGVILDGLTDALGDPMGARPSQVTTLYRIASHAMRPIQSGS